MKILFCDNSLKELLNFRGDVIKHFSKQGHSIVLVAPENTKSPSTSNIKFIPIKMNRGGMNPFNDLALFLSLLKIYYKERPDYVFHYTIKPNIYGSFSAKMLRIPSSSVVSGLGYAFNHNDLRSRVARFLYRMALNLNHSVLVLNSDNMEKLLSSKILHKEKAILLRGGEGVNLNVYRK